CGSGSSCMKHTVNATVKCNNPSGNTSCSFCVESWYAADDGMGGWTTLGYHNWPGTPGSPLACTTGDGVQVVSGVQLCSCEATGASIRVTIGVFKGPCSQDYFLWDDYETPDS